MTTPPQARPSRRAGAELLALVALVLLSACSTAPLERSVAPDMAVPAAWSNAPLAPPSGASLAQWWQRFNDPALDALVLLALQANTDVRSAQAALAQSRALRDVKAAGLLPGLGGSASAQRGRSGGNEASNSFQAGFDASWEPDVFGGKHSAVSASEADAQAAGLSLASVQVSMAAEVALTYIELRATQARLAIARSSLAAQGETLEIARWRTQAGLVSSLDVEQAVAASEQNAAQIPSLQISVAQDLSRLSVLTGQPLAALQASLAAPAAAASVVPQAPADLALAFPAQTLRQRPDVRAGEYRINAALARVDQADAARYPGFQISGSLGLRALSLGALTSGASVVSALLAGVSVPLFDGGAARAQVRAQQAALEQARIGYQATVMTALKEVEDALVSLQGNQERLTRLQVAAQAGANAQLLAGQRYASGLIDFRTVLDTQRTQLSTQDSVESTRGALSADYVRLYKALGGGWTPGVETAST